MSLTGCFGTRAMDGAMGNYYYGFAREHIAAHKEEDDPERLENLLDRGEQNLRFVLRKYRMAEPRPPEPQGATITTSTKRRRRGRMAKSPGTAGLGDGERGVAGHGGSGSHDAWTPGRQG